MKPKIYIFNNGSGPFGCIAMAISEDGEVLASHACSNEYFMPHDMGMHGSTWKHDKYDAYYPDGYELEFISYHDVDGHQGLQKAFALADAKETITREGKSE